MNIYYLQCDPEAVSIYCYSGFVVVAASESEARALITTCGDECIAGVITHRVGPHACVWHYSCDTECKLIGVAAEGVSPGIVLESFSGGRD